MLESRDTKLFLTLPQAAARMGVGVELLKRAVALRQVRSITLGSRVLVPRSAIERLAKRIRRRRTLRDMQLVKPSPASEIFALSAAGIKPLEACALLLGAMVDIVREATVCSLTTI